MDRVNYIWEWIERFGEFGNRDVVWAEKLGERLKELLPYLLRDQEMATRVPCENFLAGGGCQYRIVKMTRGNLVGVCDDKVCPSKDFTEAELLCMKVNLPKLLREVSGLLGLHTVLEPLDQRRYEWSIGTVPCVNGAEVTVYFVRGVQPHTFESAILNLLIDNPNPFILITATKYRHTPKLAQQLKGRGCGLYTLQSNLDLTPKGFAWLPGGRERWEQLLEGFQLVHSGEAAAAYKHSVAIAERIERKVEAVGRDMNALKQENDALRLQLGNQLTSLAGQVDAEFFHWVCTVLVEGSMLRAAKSLGLAHTTFRERFNRHVEKGGIYRALANVVEVRRTGLGARRLESHNAAFKGHQRSAEPVYDNRAILELLDALKSLNEDNWEDVRDEMLEILAELRG